MSKHDEGKTRWDLLPLKQVEEIVDVITWGAKKYTDNGWKTLENAEERYFAAMMRHIAAHRRGEMCDNESKLSHLAHAGACLLFLIWHQDNPTTKEDQQHADN